MDVPEWWQEPQFYLSAPLSSACLTAQDGCRIFGHRLPVLSRNPETGLGLGVERKDFRKPPDNFSFHLTGHPVYGKLGERGSREGKEEGEKKMEEEKGSGHRVFPLPSLTGAH